MSRTILELVQAFCNEVGVTQITQVVGSTDDLTLQILALANREGSELSGIATSFGGWQALHKEHTFLTVNGTADYALPADLAYFANQTQWDGAQKWELLGPIDAQQKQLLRYGVVANGPRRKFYIRNNRMYLDPVPASDGDVIAYDYYSKYWVMDVDGVTEKARIAADSDTLKIDEDCFILGLKWRFLRAKGLDYGQEERDYQLAVQQAVSRDCGTRRLGLVDRSWQQRFLDTNNIPDSGFGT
jgi:hypothetical protein